MGKLPQYMTTGKPCTLPWLEEDDVPTPPGSVLITEAGDTLVTEAGDTLITE